MAIKGVGEVGFERQHVPFIKCEAFNEGEVLIHIPGTSNVKGLAEVPKRESIGRNDTRCIGVEKCGAVEKTIGSRWRKCAVSILVASASALKWVIGGCVGSEQRLPRNAAQARIGGSKSVRRAKREGDERYAFLIALNPTDLPSAQHFVHDSALVQEFLSLADG